MLSFRLKTISLLKKYEVNRIKGLPIKIFYPFLNRILSLHREHFPAGCMDRIRG
jgi:hypothetical protein